MQTSVNKLMGLCMFVYLGLIQGLMIFFKLYVLKYKHAQPFWEWKWDMIPGNCLVQFHLHAVTAFYN